jgi:hypothetical protein
MVFPAGIIVGYSATRGIAVKQSGFLTGGHVGDAQKTRFRFGRRVLLGCLVVASAALGVWHAKAEANPADGPLAALKKQAGDVHYTKLVIAGEHNRGGIYDPSIEYTGDGKTGWLAYSSISGDFKPVGPYVHIHLARSDDHGRTWQFVKTLCESADGSLQRPGSDPLPGVWRYEVPSLCCDPTDPGREWKLFVHKYFWNAKNDRMADYGWIALRTASDPAGPWSEEVPLLGAGHVKLFGLLDAGQFPRDPYHQTKVDLNQLDPGLADGVAYSEPGTIVRRGTIYLSLTLLKPSGPERIVLLASEDHAATWRFVATLVSRGDARTLGYTVLDGSSLAAQRDKVFLLASPGNRSDTHDGTVALEFASLAEGRLKRNPDGSLAVAGYFAPQPSILSGRGAGQTDAGQSDYDEHNTEGGLLMPQFNVGAYPEVFQIFQTGRSLVP